MSTKGKRRYIVLMCAPVRVRILKNIDIKSSCIIPKVNYNYLSLHMFYLFLCSFCNTIAYKYTSSFGSDKFIDCDFQIFFNLTSCYKLFNTSSYVKTFVLIVPFIKILHLYYIKNKDFWLVTKNCSLLRWHKELCNPTWYGSRLTNTELAFTVAHHCRFLIDR